MKFGYYINLERMRLRHDFMESQLLALGLNDVFSRWVGIDAANLQIGSVQNYVPGKNRWRSQSCTRWQLSVVEVAIFESHRQIWKDVVRTNLPYAIILEDDVKLSSSLHDVIEQIDTISEVVDVLKLDGVRRHCRFGNPVESCDLEVRPFLGQRLHSAGAYLVSQEGARKLLRWSISYSDFVDAFVFGCRRNYRLFQLFPAIAIQGAIMKIPSNPGEGYVPTGSVPDAGVERAPASKGPLWFRLMREARLGIKRIPQRLGGDRKLVQEGGWIGIVPLAFDLKKYE